MSERDTRAPHSRTAPVQRHAPPWASDWYTMNVVYSSRARTLVRREDGGVHGRDGDGGAAGRYAAAGAGRPRSGRLGHHLHDDTFPSAEAHARRRERHPVCRRVCCDGDGSGRRAPGAAAGLRLPSRWSHAATACGRNPNRPATCVPPIARASLVSRTWTGWTWASRSGRASSIASTTIPSALELGGRRPAAADARVRRRAGTPRSVPIRRWSWPIRVARAVSFPGTTAR